MNNIKTFLIGFLTCACMFFIMGQTEQEMFVTNSNNGRYQISMNTTSGGGQIYEVILDTRTGQIFSREHLKAIEYIEYSKD